VHNFSTCVWRTAAQRQNPIFPTSKDIFLRILPFGGFPKCEGARGGRVDSDDDLTGECIDNHRDFFVFSQSFGVGLGILRGG